jgi:hypothetical protein
MNEEIKVRLVKYLDYLEVIGKKGAEFAEDKIPETVQQFITWEIWSNCLQASFCLFFFTAAVVAIYFIVKKAWLSEWVSDTGFAKGIISVVILVISFAAVFPICITNGLSSSKAALKAYVAPNVFLIEKAAELVKDVKKS